MEKLEYKHFKFDVVNDVIILMEYTGEEEKVVIPDEIQGQAVTVIGDGAFTFSSDSSKILEVVLPKDLETIGSFAFSSCPSLKTIKIPEHFKEFDRHTFFQCDSLEEIHLPKSVENVPEKTFLMCDSLKKVTCESEHTKFDPVAFGYNNNLQDVSFSILKQLQLKDQIRISGNLLKKLSTLTAEEQVALKDFIKKNIDLRDGLFLIGNLSVVTFLLELKGELTLEQVEEYLESSIAREETAVTAFFLDYKNQKFTKEVQDAYHSNKELVEMGLELPTLEQFQKKWKCKQLEGGICVTQYIGNDTNEVIPEALADGTKIVALDYDLNETAGGIQHFVEAKLDFGSIIHLEIKASIKTLNNMSRNASLETLILPDSIEEVERKSIFSHCKNLRTVNLPKKLTTLPIRMFMGCSSLEKIEIPEHVTLIGSHIFQDCSALKEIRLPEGITEIPSHAFSQCSSLTSVILPRKLDLIDSSAFSGCPSLKNLSMSELPENVSDCAFHDCTGLGDEQGLIILQNVLYSYLGTAEKVVIPEGTKVVAKNCFSHSNIKEVVFPSSLEKLDDHAFSLCKSLERVVSHTHLNSIGHGVFHGCSNLNPFDLPDTLNSLGEQAFSSCLKFVDQDGFIIVKHRLYNYYGKETVISIPEGVEQLERLSFLRSRVKEVTLPTTLKVLHQGDFRGAGDLEKIIFPQNLVDMGLLEYGKKELIINSFTTLEIKG